MSIEIDEWPGGYVITKGDSRIRLTESEAAELTATFGRMLCFPRVTTPSKARLQRYPITHD